MSRCLPVLALVCVIAGAACSGSPGGASGPAAPDPNALPPGAVNTVPPKLPGAAVNEVQPAATLEVVPLPFRSGQTLSISTSFRAPVHCQRMPGLVVRLYDLETHPDVSYAGLDTDTPSIVDSTALYDSEADPVSVVNRTFDAMTVPTNVVAQRLYMAIFRTCLQLVKEGTNPETGKPLLVDRVVGGAPIGAATFTRECTGGKRTAVCLYHKD